MTNFQTPNSKKYDKDIYEWTYQFSLKVVKFTRKLPKSIEADVIKKQLMRSATSIAANLQEADGSKTRQEFRHAVSISKKEAKETKLWLRMIADLYKVLSLEATDLISENEQIIKILSAIVINTKI
ncbi:MAG TPA: four helix bundle protein [Candidatus Saccharimonadales bacterium]|nr:four helix bundle protein [Candidatus Saccharimonadales bacterium]